VLAAWSLSSLVSWGVEAPVVSTLYGHTIGGCFWGGMHCLGYIFFLSYGLVLLFSVSGEFLSLYEL
jgi:hypothetical protein